MPDSLIGRRLGGRYRIDEHLGSGAMGDVYLGWDEHVGKSVAVKVISSVLMASASARSDFEREAKTLAKIQHPNVAGVLDFGHDRELDLEFLVMEYVSGVTMDQRAKAGPLPEADVVRLGIQLAQGMKAAHDQGIVHSDLKPANVRVTESGTLKILDFGIARRLKTIVDATATHEPGKVRGTPSYMAPEHMRGEDPDTRSDIYSAGVLLYQVATKQLPFPDQEINLLVYKVENVPPPPPRKLNRAISPRLEAILLKCLAKDPQDRFVSADELEQALRGEGRIEPKPDPFPWRRVAMAAGVVLALGAAVAVWRSWPAIAKFLEDGGRTQRPESTTRLAVLPFRNLTPHRDRDYLGEGISDELSTRMGQLNYGQLRVIGYPATSRYKNQAADPGEVRKSLGADYILDGSVLDDDPLVINARLSETTSGTQRWAHRFQGDSGVADAIRMQQSIVDSICSALAIPLAENSGGVRPATPSDEGYDHALRGQSHLDERTPDALTAALGDFDAAIASDPNQASFHANKARTLVLLENFGVMSAQDAMPKALAAARTALTLDSSLAAAHAAMAAVQQDYERDWKRAEREYQRAIALDPSAPWMRQSYASLLLVTGRKESALEQLRAALDLDPLSFPIHIDLGAYHYLAGDYAKALEQFDRAIQLGPREPIAHYERGITLVELGRQDDAVESIAKAMELGGATASDMTSMRQAFKSAGTRGYWTWKRDQLLKAARSRYVTAFELARVYAALGDKDRAFDFLRASADDRESALAGIVVEPHFRGLADDPRYGVMLRRLGLPTPPSRS